MTCHVTDSMIHNECVYAVTVPGMTVKNSRFTNCATMDLVLTETWWSPPPPAYGNVTIENNVFGHSHMVSDSEWHYYGLSDRRYLGPSTKGKMSGFTVRYNTFEIPVGIGAYGAATNTRWVGNPASWPCISGVTYKKNVGWSCGSSDKAVSPAQSTQTQHRPVRVEQPRRQRLPPEVQQRRHQRR